MPRHKTSKKRTHKRRRRGGFMEYLPEWLGGPPSTPSLPPPPPPPPSMPSPSMPSLGGKSRRRRR
jgi:hypothetical protein